MRLYWDWWKEALPQGTSMLYSVTLVQIFTVVRTSWREQKTRKGKTFLCISWSNIKMLEILIRFSSCMLPNKILYWDWWKVAIPWGTSILDQRHSYTMMYCGKYIMKRKENQYSQDDRNENIIYFLLIY